MFWGVSAVRKRPPLERRFDASRLDKGKLRLPVARGKPGIGLRLRLRLRLREDLEKSEMRDLGIHPLRKVSPQQNGRTTFLTTLAQ